MYNNQTFNSMTNQHKMKRKKEMKYKIFKLTLKFRKQSHQLIALNFNRTN